MKKSENIESLLTLYLLSSGHYRYENMADSYSITEQCFLWFQCTSQDEVFGFSGQYRYEDMADSYSITEQCLGFRLQFITGRFFWFHCAVYHSI
jgi:hypothetical protein